MCLLHGTLVAWVPHPPPWGQLASASDTEKVLTHHHFWGHRSAARLTVTGRARLSPSSSDRGGAGPGDLTPGVSPRTSQTWG